MKLDPCLTPFTKINSKYIKNLNIRPETVKLLEENIGGKLLPIGLSNDFLNLPPNLKQQIKNKQVGLHQINKLLHSQRNDQQNEKATYKKGENICNHISDKWLISKIYFKKLIQLHSKKPNNPILKTKNLNRFFPKKIFKWPTGT